jgi:hypothetical protein
MSSKGKFVSRFVLPLGLLSLSNSASAVPIRFDFNGVVRETNIINTGAFTSDHSNDGAAFSVSMTVETEGLTKSTSTAASGVTVNYADAPSAPELVSSSVIINGIAYDVGIYGFDQGGIRFLDSNGPVSCGVGCNSFTPDQFGLSDSSTEILLGTGPFPADGVYRNRSVNINSADPDNFGPNLFDYASMMDYFNLAGTDDPLSILTLPIGFLGGSYNEGSFTCSSVPFQRCTGDYSKVTVFTINSVSRSIASVPEPTSFGLLGLGFLGLAAKRRSGKHC